MAYRPQDKTCKLCFAKEGDLISLLGLDGEPCSDVWEVCAENQPGRKPAPEGASNGLYSDERDFYLHRLYEAGEKLHVRAPMPHLSTRVVIIKRRDVMENKTVQVVSLKPGDRFMMGGVVNVVVYVGTYAVGVEAEGQPKTRRQIRAATAVTPLPPLKVEVERDLTLLRPMDASKLQPGDKVLHFQGDRETTFIDGPDDRGYFCVRNEQGRCSIRRAEWYRMKPLAWVEGRPVYHGDTLYFEGKQVTACDPADNVGWMTCRDGFHRDTKKMTWEKPKVKKEGWINIYGDKGMCVHPTKEQAEKNKSEGVKACVKIHWEE